MFHCTDNAITNAQLSDSVYKHSHYHDNSAGNTRMQYCNSLGNGHHTRTSHQLFKIVNQFIGIKKI